MSPGAATLGRTNREFPAVWLRLAAPEAPSTPGWAAQLCEEAAASGAPIDVSSQPALWGAHLRGTKSLLMASGGAGAARATNDRHASDLVQADLLQLLCGLGRDFVDVFFLRFQRPLAEHQINGALESLELARQEGHLRHLGLWCDGPPHEALGMWHFHDAFELLLVPFGPSDRAAYDVLEPVARQRRVGVVVQWKDGSPTDPFPFLEHPALLTVRDPAEVRSAQHWAQRARR